MSKWGNAPLCFSKVLSSLNWPFSFALGILYALHQLLMLRDFSIAILDFPSCVIGDQPELTAESLEIGTNLPYCWRNLFSCVNLLRILNKLTKWKHSRIMVLRNHHIFMATCRLPNHDSTLIWHINLLSLHDIVVAVVVGRRSDVGRLQVGAHPEAYVKGEACPAPVIRPQTAENANKISGPTVAQIQYENDECNLSKSPSPVERRLGFWKWWVILFFSSEHSQLSMNQSRVGLFKKCHWWSCVFPFLYYNQ